MFQQIRNCIIVHTSLWILIRTCLGHWSYPRSQISIFYVFKQPYQFAGGLLHSLTAFLGTCLTFLQNWENPNILQALISQTSKKIQFPSAHPEFLPKCPFPESVFSNLTHSPTLILSQNILGVLLRRALLTASHLLPKFLPCEVQINCSEQSHRKSFQSSAEKTFTGKKNPCQVYWEIQVFVPCPTAKQSKTHRFHLLQRYDTRKGDEFISKMRHNRNLPTYNRKPT